MKTILNLILLFLPAFTMIAIPQTRVSIRPFWAIAFVLFSIGMVIAGRLKNTAVLQNFVSRYMYGLALGMIFTLICATFPVGGFISQPLYLDHSDETAEAILVLASGATFAGDPALSGYQRVLHGIELLQKNRAPVLYISTGNSSINGYAESQWVASLTKMLKVDAEQVKILVSERITTTKTEAEHAVEKLKAAGIGNILLVTSGTHVYRSKLVYEKLGMKVFPAPCHSRKGLYYSMGHYLRSLNAAVHEWVGLLYYRLRNFI